MKWWDWMPWSQFFEYWVLRQLFHPLLSTSSRGFLVPLCFLPWVVSSVYLRILFSWAPQSLWTVTAAMRLKDTCSLEEKLWETYTKPAKKQKHHLANKGPYRQSYVFFHSFCWYFLITACESSSLAFCMINTLHISLNTVMIYSLNVLLSQFWTSPLFHVQF